MGAQWIHGRKGNPIYELANNLNLLDKSTESKFFCILSFCFSFWDIMSFLIWNFETTAEFGDITYYATQDGTAIDTQFADKMLERIEKLFDKVESRIENDLDEKHDKPFRIYLFFHFWVHFWWYY